MYHLPEILDSRHPYVALLGPWIPPEHTTLKLVKLLKVLPEGMIKSFDGFTRFMISRVVPSVQLSADVVSPILGVFKTGRENEDEFTAAKRYGTTVEEAKQIDKLTLQYTFAEERSGINDEALLVLKRTDAGSWGACEDYEKYMEELTKKERDRLANEGQGTMHVDVYYAEDDMLIGKTGQAFFESCWKLTEGVVEVQGREMPGTTHETVITDFDKGALKLVFDRIATESSVGKN